MPRPRVFEPRQVALLTGDQLSSTAQIPGLPHTFIAVLENLSCKGSGSLKPVEVANSGLFPQLVEILRGDYETLSPDLLTASQRMSKLRLLTSCCCLLLPDIKSKELSSLLELLCKLLYAAVGQGVKLEEKLCILQLLTAFLNRCSDKLSERLGELLGYLCVLSGLHGSIEGVSLVPTNLPHLHFTLSGQDGARRESSCTDTSGSEFSDQDMSGDLDLRRRRDEGLVEREALNAIYIIAKKCQKKEVVSFWFIFLPDKSFCPLKSGVSDLLCNPSKKIRMLGISILVEFINHSQQFLALAQHQDKDTSYTSLSAALALSLLNLHRSLLNRAHEPLGNTEYVALLKLLSTLGENCPYSRLTPGLLDRLVNSLMELAERERNPVIQVAVLSVFVSLGHGTGVPELKEVTGEMFKFIVPRSLPVPQTQVADNNVRYMALQALSVLTQLDIQMFIKNAPGVKKLIDTSLQDTDPSIVLHTFRFIKNFAKHLTEAVAKNQEPDSRLRNLAIAFWIDFMKPANFQLLDRHPNANIRSAFCDCLAEVGAAAFSELPEQKRITAITYVLGQCRSTVDSMDASPDLVLQDRAALSSCLRTLGIFVTYPCYLTDTAFHIDVADAILPHLPTKVKDKKSAKSVPDPGNKTVRVSASWALANLTDILIQSSVELNRTGEVDEFPLSLVRRILQSGICCAQDPGSAVNTKSNAVRCIGNMLNYISPEFVSEQEYQEMMDGGTRAIISNISHGKIMKIRWNACYASANVLKKEGVTEGSGAWVKDLVTCLLDTVQNFQNFKVRINAALALGCVWDRSVLGSRLLPVIQALVHSLESSQNLEVFGEWQHQANLVNQLCISICHLLTFIQNQLEFSRCVSMMTESWDLVESSFQSSARRISPEKFVPFLQANSHIAGFQAKNEEESQFQSLLKSCVENID